MSQAQRDYYDVLGVTRDADADAIKQAFRSRARELHPDVSREPDAEERFTELATAYNILSRPTKRLLYDRFGYLGHGNGGFEPAQSTGSSGGNESPSSVFDFTEVQVEFFEALRGATRKVQVTTVGLCTACRGTGAARGSPVEACARCDGEGLLRRAEDVDAGRVLQIDKCPECAGTGKIVIVPCARCLGSGRETTKQKVKLDIPPGVEDGRMIRAEAAPSRRERGARRRDVYVVLRVLPDRGSHVVQAIAAVALVVALALFVLVLVAPDVLGLRL
jgi:molecular chaperone DnaJ